MSISCSKCQRVLGKEILGCDQLKSGNCSYQISTKATAGFMKKSFALSWLFLGFGILFFTYFFSEPDAEYSAKFLVFESLLTTFLYLIGIASILIGYFSLNLKKTCIYNPITMDNCTFYFAGAVEFYSKIISNWENINIKLKPILNIDEFAIGGLFYSNNWSLKDFEKLDINNLTSVQKILVDYYKLLIIGLIKSGKVTASVAEVYCAKSQQLENIEDQKTLFLKPNIKNTKDQSISNSIIALLIACIREEQHTKSITLEDLFSELFSCKSNIDAAYKMLKKEVGRYKEIIPKLISEFKRNEKLSEF